MKETFRLQREESMKTVKMARIEIVLERHDGKELDEQELDQTMLDALNDMDNDTYCTTATWVEHIN